MTALAPDLAPTRDWPLNPPRSWLFDKPEWFTPGDKLTLVTEGPEAGRVAGTVASHAQCILDGQPGCWRAPDSPTAYQAAHQGDTLTAEGELVHTANVGGGINHARVAEKFSGAVKHYDNTASQLMRVRYYDDGDWIIALGAAWPDITDRDVAMVRASAMSGDWRYRPELGAFDLAGAQLVNNPGFPLIRAAAVGDTVVYLGGMGGVGPLDDGPCCSACERKDDLTEAVAHLATLGEPVLDDLERAIAEIAARHT